MEPIVKVEGLSKQYRIGAAQAPYATLRESMMAMVRAPLNRLRSGPRVADSMIWALRDVSFEVLPGEVVGVIGRNGAGKSTLLKILSRITEPTSGRARIRGRVGSLLEVGTGFHPELTGRENIYLNGAILGMRKSEIKRRFDEIVAFAEVETFIDTPVKHYSSGMYLRLAFAVAAHLDPEVLIVDEVLSVGDASFQKKCLKKMENVSTEGRTIIFVSHNMPAVTRICRRAIWLDAGRLLQSGPSEQVASSYLRHGTMTTAAREWEFGKAPGNHLARLLAVRVLDKDGHVAESVDIRDPVRIEIDYYNFSSGKFPYASVQIFDENGTCLFNTGDYVNPDWRHQSRAFTGRVRSTCTIPGNFLTEGQFSVLVALTTQVPAEFIANEPGAVSFLVVDNSQGDGARGEYAGPFPGVVRPLLDWQVQREGAQTMEG